jgi:glycosyltransferase involved in cell wall biosynthesis
MIVKNTIKKINNSYRNNKNVYKFVALLLLIIAVIVILVILIKENYINIGYNTDKPEKLLTDTGDEITTVDGRKIIPYKMKRPFLNINDNNGKLTQFVFITHPFSRDECIKQYNEAKEAGMEFIGISSYCDFPALITNPHDLLSDPKHPCWGYNYFDLCRGWCYCFRDPAKYGIPDASTGYPQILLSESDFAKYNFHKPDTDVKKEYDFLYVCLKDNDKCEPGWQSYNRNWEQAEKLIEIMCTKYHLKGLLVGRKGCKVSGCHKTTDFMEYDKFIKQYNKCRFVFVPNSLDASPRVLTEAMCYNLPVLCNAKILGGWKYVTSEVGEQFNVAENDFEDVLSTFLAKFNTYKPREFYMREFSEEKQGKRLLEFVKECCGNDAMPTNADYLVPAV